VSYPSVDQLLAAADLPETDITVSGWGVTLRVRPPSLAQQEQIIRASQIAAVRQARIDAAKLGPDLPWQALLPADGRDWLTYCVETLRLCVVSPQLTEAQARQLRDKNPHVVEPIVAYIWDRGRLDQAAIAAIVHDLAGPDPQTQTAPAASGGE
jgi:hypothetical protein